MEKQPLVSVIVPVYNVEKYLEQCLDSIINQTHKNIEIICVDDGSTDKSLEILNKYKETHSNIILIPLKKNHGVSFARNKALSVVNGDYVCFIDSDDYVEKNFCEQLLSGFTKDIDLVFGGHIKLNVLGKKISPWLPQIDFSSNIMNDMFLLTKHRNVSQKMFKVNIIKNNNIQFDESLHYMEDALFLMMYVKFCKKAKSIKKPLYIVRINENSLCRSAKYQERRKKEKTIAMNKIDNIFVVKKNTNIIKPKYF